MMRATARRNILSLGLQPNLDAKFGRAGASSAPVKAVDTGIKKSTLPNGTKVVTHDRDGTTSTFGMYVDAGVKYDAQSTHGLSHVMRYAMLTSNMSQSMFQVDRTFRSVGSSYGSVEIGKRFLGWTSDAPRVSWKAGAEHFATCMTIPRFVEADVERFRDTLDNELEELRWTNPREYVVDQLETVAFYREPLGQSRMAPALYNDKCNHTALLDKYCSTFTPDRITLVGVNINHDELAAWHSTLPFQHTIDAPHHAGAARPTLKHVEEAKQYYPGRSSAELEQRSKAMGTKHDMPEEAICAVGWLTNGSEGNIKDFATTLVARAAMNVALDTGLNHMDHAPHAGIRTFYRAYSTAGLAGYTLRGSPAETLQMTKDALKMLPSKASDLGAAKARATVAFHQTHLEMQQDYAAFLVTSQFSEEEIIGAIKAVSDSDVSKAFDKMKATAPVMFSTGDVSEMPSLRQLGIKA